MIKTLRKSMSRPQNLVRDYDEPFVKTQNNLAVTPADMHRMVDRGIPVSPQNDALFFDGVNNPSFDIPVDMRRGCDVNDVWNAEQDAQKKFKSAHLKDMQTYG